MFSRQDHRAQLKSIYVQAWFTFFDPIMAPPLQHDATDKRLLILPLSAGVFVTSLSFAFALLGLIQDWYIPQLPHFFFGLLILCAVSALLSVPLILEWTGIKEEQRPNLDHKERPRFDTSLWQQVCA
jgi:hypothetical protein